MKEWIRERINRIESLNDRRVLRDIVNGALVNMQQYNEDLYEILDERLRNELADFRLEFDVYTAICSREDYDPINDFLFPMDPNDIEIVQYNLREVSERVSAGEEVCLGRIFLQCETSKIKDLLLANHTFVGKIYTQSAEYDARLALKPCTHYKDMIEDLYKSYMFNDIAWKTVHAPYLEKFVDVVLIGQPELKSDETMRSFSVDLMEYEPYKLTDRIPLWNIRHFSAECTHFPMPAYDSINYEHTIRTFDLGKQDNYIVHHTNDGVLYVKRNVDELVVVIPEDTVRKWQLTALHTPKEVKMPWLKQPIASNERTKSFLERYAATLSMTIRSKGEIERLLNSFKQFSGWRLVEAKILPSKRVLNWKESEDVNFFLADHVRIAEEKPVLELSFESDAPRDYVFSDHLNFFVSEVQLVFPDYYCIGKICEASQ